MREKIPIKREAVSAKDAAALLDVSERTVFRLIKSRKLPAIKFGKQWRILLADIRRGT